MTAGDDDLEVASSSSGLEISIDRGSCMAAGECVHLAPATFEIDDERRASLRDDWLSGGDAEEQILDAAMSCPNFSIEVRRDGRVVM